MDYRQFAISVFKGAVAAVQPQRLIPAHLRASEAQLEILGETIPWKETGSIWVVGAGKAAAAMAQAVESVVGDHLQGGLILTKYQHALPLQIIQCREAAHPVPDEQGVAATRAMIALLHQVDAEDTVICLLSGGASALWADLPDGASLEDLQQVFSALLNSGADIAEINTVRKHLSSIKGGQLPRFAPQANWFTLMISDVPGDDMAVIGSGPTVPDTRSFEDARNILRHYGIWSQLPDSLRNHLEQGCDGKIPDTPKQGDPIFKRVKNQIVGSNALAIQAAKDMVKAEGWSLIDFPVSLAGNTALAAASLLHSIRSYEGPLPACLIAGGETTVVVTGRGRGGRNQHLALTILSALELDPLPSGWDWTILCAGTDGTDGPTDAAGAIISRDTVRRMSELGLSSQQYLDEQDAYHFFEQTGDLLITGATQTNVMDLVVILLTANS